ncbi:MAG: hypothetical protein ACI4V4_04850 [Eubacterium sp.]
MSNLNAFERLYSLVNKIVPDIDDDLRLISLLYACASGFELIKNYYDEIKNQQYLDTMSEETIDKYCALLDIYSYFSYEEKKNQIKEKLSEIYNEFCADEFISYYKTFGNKFYIVTDNFEIAFHGISSSNILQLHVIMKMLEYYLPPFVYLKLTGSGLTFQEWETLEMSFQSFDYIGAPFSMLDTMKL